MRGGFMFMTYLIENFKERFTANFDVKARRSLTIGVGQLVTSFSSIGCSFTSEPKWISLPHAILTISTMISTHPSLPSINQLHDSRDYYPIIRIINNYHFVDITLNLNLMENNPYSQIPNPTQFSSNTEHQFTTKILTWNCPHQICCQTYSTYHHIAPIHMNEFPYLCQHAP